MTKGELKDRIKVLALQKYGKVEQETDIPFEFEEMTRFPELKSVILDLLTLDYDSFVESIDWVAPKPTMFRINLKNGYSFYLTWNERSWAATIEGKKYYLLNTPEKQRALASLSRLLRHMQTVDNDKVEEGEEEESSDPLDNMAAEAEPEEEA